MSRCDNPQLLKVKVWQILRSKISQTILQDKTLLTLLEAGILGVTHKVCVGLADVALGKNHTTKHNARINRATAITTQVEDKVCDALCGKLLDGCDKLLVKGILEREIYQVTNLLATIGVNLCGSLLIEGQNGAICYGVLLVLGGSKCIFEGDKVVLLLIEGLALERHRRALVISDRLI